jgi:hypothetical protein
MRLRLLLATALVLISFAGLACGGGSSSSSGATTQASKPVDPNAPETSAPGDIPDDQAFVRFSPPGAGFSVEVPEGWSQTPDGTAIVFTDKLNSVRIESASASKPPTAAELVKKFPGAKASTVRRKAGTAIRITYEVKSKPDAVTGKSRTLAIERYVFWHQGKEAILTLSGAKGADNVDPWKRVTDSLRWKA